MTLAEGYKVRRPYALPGIITGMTESPNSKEGHVLCLLLAINVDVLAQVTRGPRTWKFTSCQHSAIMPTCVAKSVTQVHGINPPIEPDNG